MPPHGGAGSRCVFRTVPQNFCNVIYTRGWFGHIGGPFFSNFDGTRAPPSFSRTNGTWWIRPRFESSNVISSTPRYSGRAACSMQSSNSTAEMPEPMCPIVTSVLSSLDGSTCISSAV